MPAVPIMLRTTRRAPMSPPFAGRRGIVVNSFNGLSYATSGSSDDRGGGLYDRILEVDGGAANCPASFAAAFGSEHNAESCSDAESHGKTHGAAGPLIS